MHIVKVVMVEDQALDHQVVQVVVELLQDLKMVEMQ